MFCCKNKTLQYYWKLFLSFGDIYFANMFDRCQAVLPPHFYAQRTPWHWKNIRGPLHWKKTFKLKEFSQTLDAYLWKDFSVWLDLWPSYLKYCKLMRFEVPNQIVVVELKSRSKFDHWLTSIPIPTTIFESTIVILI